MPSSKSSAEVRLRYAEARTGRAGIVNGGLLRGKLGIDAQPDARIFAAGIKFLLLCEGIENDMVADVRDLVELAVEVGGAKHMVFLAHLLFAEPRLVQTARRRAADVLPDERVFAVGGKRLLRQQDFTPPCFAPLFSISLSFPSACPRR